MANKTLKQIEREARGEKSMKDEKEIPIVVTKEDKDLFE